MSESEPPFCPACKAGTCQVHSDPMLPVTPSKAQDRAAAAAVKQQMIDRHALQAIGARMGELVHEVAGLRAEVAAVHDDVVTLVGISAEVEKITALVDEIRDKIAALVDAGRA